jgi:hypothetical protein
MIKLYFISLYVLISTAGNLFLAQSYFGSIFENGVESRLNWHFLADQMCVEYIHINSQNEEIELHTRLYLNANTNEVTIVNVLQPELEKFVVSADSIVSTQRIIDLNLTLHQKTKDIEDFGACHTYNGKSHLGNYLFVVDSSNIALWKFAAFFKDDALIKWWMTQQKQGVPIQMVHVNPTGQVIRSVQFHRKEATVPRTIF